MSEPSAESGLLSPFAKGVSKFSNKFMQTVSSSAKRRDANLVCSPMSCLMTLAMAQAGAKGRTLETMTEALCLPKDLKETHQGFYVLLQTSEMESASTDFWSKEEEFLVESELSLANRIYLANNGGLRIDQDYLATLDNTFNATAVAVDFSDPATAATINKWVATETKNKIKNLVQPGSFGGSSVVLINTIYFKCDWQSKFKSHDTHPNKFFLNEKDAVVVPFMFQKEKFQLAVLPELDAMLLRLPYKDPYFSFVVVLPNQKTGLAALESKLATKDLPQLMQMANYEQVKVYLPKFKFETTLDLKGDLCKMGMENAFDPSCADFTGITKTHPIFLSEVVQKAIIEVDEKGTVAAAATVAQMLFGGSVVSFQKPIEFKCDHPFAFFIVYKGKYTLFAGSMKNPAQK